MTKSFNLKTVMGETGLTQLPASAWFDEPQTSLVPRSEEEEKPAA
jgi:hypothetical protein